MGCLQKLPFIVVFLVFFSLIQTHKCESAGNPSEIALPIDTNNTDIHELMPTYGFPPGLIPENVKSYVLHDSGSFVITMNSPCYVQFERLVYYGTDIRGKFSYGTVRDLSGIQAKAAFLWFSVTGIEATQSDGTIKFSVGPFSESLPASSFAEIPACGSKASLRSPLDYAYI